MVKNYKLKTRMTFVVACLMMTLSSWAQVDVTATGGTLSASYTTLGAAFSAINAGTHTGSITIGISGNTTEAGSCVLNSGSGAAPASYTDIVISPTVDAVSISGATTGGRGLIELKGADNVMINGDNAGTPGTNRDLSIINTAANTTTYTSVIRVANAATVVTSSDNIQIQNCNIIGSAVGRNASANTSTTGSENTTFGIYVGGNGGATAIDAPTAVTSVTTNTAPSGTTVNNFTINNCFIISCARAVVFNGAAATVCNVLTIGNNTIGASGSPGAFPFSAITNTVYTQGVWVSGVDRVDISNNTIQNILSYVGTTMNGILLNSSIGTGSVTIGNNSILTVGNNGSSSAIGISVASIAGGSLGISNNTVSNIQNNASASVSGVQITGSSATSTTVSRNKISGVWARSTGGYAARGILISAGSNTLIQNNMIWDINMCPNNSATTTTFGARGINITAGTGHKVYNNSINLFGPVITSANPDITVCLGITSTTITGMDVRNNIFSNTMSGGSAASPHVCLQLPAGATSAMNLTLNNNAYYSGSVAGQSGILVTTAPTLYTAANFIAGATAPATNSRSYTSTLSAAGTNDDMSYASTNAAPFISSTNLHLDLSSSEITNVEQKGDPAVPVAFDIDNEVRPNASTTNPDMGADEVIMAICSSANGGTISPATYSKCNGQTVTMTSTGVSTGMGITYQWMVATTSGGPYTNVVGGTGANATSYTSAALSTGTYYYVLQTTCSAGPLTGLSNEVTVTVNGLPTVTVTPTTGSYCNPGGTAVVLTAGGATNYSWAPTAGLSASTGGTVNATPAITTTYTVTGTDGNGCSNTATTAITTNPAVSIASVLASPASICSGANSTITASASLILPAYCTAGATSTSFEKISNITFGTINNTSSATAGYENFVAQSTNVTAGVSTPISIGISSAYANDDRIHIWVDMDNDGVFADPAENVLNLAVSTFCPACAGTNTTITGNITIPASAFNGSTRMRIRLEDQSSGGNLTPCGTSTYGQVEDYTVNISGGTANPALTYAWTPSTFLSSTSVANPTATAMTTTTTYSVTATSAAGCSAQGNVTVTVNALPTVTASSDDADNTVCENTMVTLTGGGATSYTWDNSVSDGVAFTPAATTTYNVTGTDGNGCSNTANITLTVNTLPTVTASSDDADNTVCENTMVTLTGGGATSYTWDNGVNDAVAFAATTTTTYNVTGTDGNGCSNTANITLTVNTLPTVTASSDDADNTVCENTMVTLTGGGATSYTWDNGVSDAVAFAATTTTTYNVTGTDGNGCSNTANITLTVNALPTVTASSDDADNAICENTMVTLTGGGATSYTWDNSVSDGVAFTPASTTTYNVTGTDGNGCSNTANITITVNTLPTVTASSDDADNAICEGLMVTLNGGGADTYTWDNGVMDGASFAPTTTTLYTVTGTDLNGCSNTATITITVNPLPVVDLAPFTSPVCDNGGVVSLVDGTPTGGVFSGLGVSGNTFDPSAVTPGMIAITYSVTDGNGCIGSDVENIQVDLCTGIASNDSQFINLYPNPTTGVFTVVINNANSNQVVITIVDMQGKVVFNESDKNVSAQYNKQIDLTELAKGIYYVKMNIGTDVKIEKLIVQ